MPVIPSSLLLLCLLFLFRNVYSVKTVDIENDPIIFVSKNETASREYELLVPFEETLQFYMSNAFGTCESLTKLCLCSEPVDVNDIEPIGAKPTMCDPQSSSLCFQWGSTAGRVNSVEAFSNAKGASTATLDSGPGSSMRIEISLKPDFPDKNVSIVKLNTKTSGDLTINVVTWALDQKTDSDNYGIVRFIRMKFIHPGTSCAARLNLKNSARWMPDVSALKPNATEPVPTVEEEEEEETTTESVAQAGVISKVGWITWIVCVVGVVIWMIWTVVYIILLALAFNRRCCFVMMDPPEVVDDVQVYSSGKNP